MKNIVFKKFVVLVMSFTLLQVIQSDLVKVDKTFPISPNPAQDMAQTVNPKFLFTSNLNSSIDIQIAGNPTTGYSWYLTNYSTMDTDKLTATNLKAETGSDKAIYQTSDSYVANPSINGQAGVGGVYNFYFTTKNTKGTVILEFTYMRPFNVNDNPYRITVNLTLSHAWIKYSTILILLTLILF
jgi:predicted secreted protein